LDGRTLALLCQINGHKQRRHVQAAAWANLPVLNEWRRLFPDRDPVDVHEEIWGISREDLQHDPSYRVQAYTASIGGGSLRVNAVGFEALDA